MDVGHLQSLRPEVDDQGWIRINFDSGAGWSAFPADADYGDISGPPAKIRLKTASGEILEGGSSYRVEGTDEYGESIGVNGIKAPVHKPLASAGRITDKGADAWLTKDGGYMIHANCPAQKEIRDAIERILKKHQYKNVTQLYKENGIYNFYVKGKVKTTGGTSRAGPSEAKDICGQETNAANVVSESSATRPSASAQSGNPRQGVRQP